MSWGEVLRERCLRWPAGTGDETPLGSVRGGYVERGNEVGIGRGVEG